VDAPIGIMFPALPVGCRVEVVAGQPYHVIESTYYQQVRGGYVVVQQPSVEVVTVVAPITKAVAQQSVTVWLENPNGSKTPVELEKTEAGTWRGPNEEVYDSLPTESDLRATYGL
jgi:hypothetical protein